MKTDKKLKNKKQTVAVTIGRFQVADLHYAHIYILYNLLKSHDKLCVFLGVSSATGTNRDPLDFESRKKMLEKQFPDIIIKPVYDNLSDELWSKKLDEEIQALFPEQEVTIYGGRDSFLDHYIGKYKTKEFAKINHFPGTEVREKIGKTVKDSSEWREGQIYLSQNQYPRLFTTIDIAVLANFATISKEENYDKLYNTKKGKELYVLLGRKEGESKLRFVGGFVDPTDNNLETACRRELYEETDIEADGFEYLSSNLIDDWRYKNTKDRIMTIFFASWYIYGRTFKAKDDICELDWYPVNKNTASKMNDSHKILFGDLLHYCTEYSKNEEARIKAEVAGQF